MKNILFFLFVSLVSLTCAPIERALNGDDWMFQSIERLDRQNPVMKPDRRSDYYCPVRRKTVDWEQQAVFNPAAVRKDNRIWLLYRAQDEYGTSRIGLANSRNGYDFEKNTLPVLRPDQDAWKDIEWEGGCEDPRVVKRKDGLYIMTYTAYDRKVARLCIATSRDLLGWDKQGVVLRDRKYRDFWSKSGAIVCKKDGKEIIAQKIKGKYWMYWGDTDLFMAYSEDLISWKPYEDKEGNLVRVMMPRSGWFDSRLVEPGPFALMQKDGILLLYNCANSASSGDKTIGADVYSIGQVLFSSIRPWDIRARSNRVLLTAERDYEKKGETPNICFLTGMVWDDGRWLLYYGAGDARVAVAEGRE